MKIEDEDSHYRTSKLLCLLLSGYVFLFSHVTSSHTFLCPSVHSLSAHNQLRGPHCNERSED